MACGSCRNRQSLLKRTVNNLVRTIKSGSTTQVSVDSTNDAQCKIKVRLTTGGYVAECTTHNKQGDPAPVPELAKVDCKND